MVKLNGKTIKAKVKATRNPLFGDGKYTGTEPVWDTERAKTMDDDRWSKQKKKKKKN